MIDQELLEAIDEVLRFNEPNSVKGSIIFNRVKTLIEDALWLPCCHVSGEHDVLHFERRSYVCQRQMGIALIRFCRELGINPVVKSEPNCFWCKEYPEKKQGDGLRLLVG